MFLSARKVILQLSGGLSLACIHILLTPNLKKHPVDIWAYGLFGSSKAKERPLFLSRVRTLKSAAKLAHYDLKFSVGGLESD